MCRHKLWHAAFKVLSVLGSSHHVACVCVCVCVQPRSVPSPVTSVTTNAHVSATSLLTAATTHVRVCVTRVTVACALHKAHGAAPVARQRTQTSAVRRRRVRVELRAARRCRVACTHARTGACSMPLAAHRRAASHQCAQRSTRARTWMRPLGHVAVAYSVCVSVCVCARACVRVCCITQVSFR